MEKRVFLIVLDSFGIGAEPDAAAFGDEGTNTLGAIAQIPVKLINKRFIADFSFRFFHAKTPSLAFLHKRRRGVLGI